jgi:hypothetical protein
MLVFPRYSHHTLTGRLAHHRDTSYGLLVFLMMAAGVLLLGATWPALAAGQSQQQATQQAASDLATQCASSPANNGCPAHAITINAVVPPARPTGPAIITNPKTGQSFSADPVTVSGTCPHGAIVKIFTNGIFVGSIICSASDQFSIPVDLVIGSNSLTALAFNTLDQEGPTSPAVNVTLTTPAGGLGFSNELLLQSVNYYRGVQPGQSVTWPITIVGGLAPYAVNIDWGDGTSELLTRLAPGPFTVTHTYKTAGTGYLGTFPLIIRAADSVGHSAYLQLTTIVNPATGATSANKVTPSVNELIIIWPIWIVLLLMIISFWLGEKREKRIMQKQLEALA